MSIFVAITIALIVGKVLCMAYNKMPSDVLALFIIAVTLVTTTLSTEEALSCFSSPTVILVGVLSVLVAGLIHSGVLHWIVKNPLGTPSNRKKALLRIMLPASIISAFISNIAVVQLFIPVIKIWSKRLKIAPSRLLIPLSYASTLGGLCSLIGNTPNLVVAEFYSNKTGQQMDFFEPLIPGLFCTAIGIISVVLLHRFIPIRRSPEENFESSAEYTVELMVPTDCPHVGETIEEASLFNVPGGQLIEIVRFDREVISPVPPDEFILGGDRLVYSGHINDILELRNTHGMVNATHHVFSVSEINSNRKLQMASVDANSPLIGQRMIDIEFENRNGIVLVAAAREGERIIGSPREVELRSGDTLLFEGSKLIPENFEGNLNFFDHVALPQNNKKMILSSLIMVGMVLLTTVGDMKLLNAGFLAAIIMGVTRCFSVEQLQRSINWKMLMIFAGSVCLGRAIEVTGIAQSIANGLISVSGTNTILVLSIIAVTATLFTEFISNTTAAAVFTPIAIHTANTLDVNPMAFVISLMIAVSCSFATPIGSDTNTLVYGPGGYKFFDYMRIGIYMNIIMLIANIFIVSLLYL
ncbi:MAG: anion permease [Bacteroidales bacterium]|nr:anion permease [Bacteroidales bacterium]